MEVSLKSCLGISAILLAGSGTAFAVPSDQEAWRSDQHGIIVYKDAVDPSTYWFVPKVRFESTSDQKTLLRRKRLENGSVEYAVRIIPYFSKDLKELAAQNISNIRQDSQLKPVIAKSIGISLPDFGYKFASAEVTNFQYLDAPRLVKFSLSAEDAEMFETFYGDSTGVNVDFTISYDGMMTDKFYNIQVSCKNIADELKIEALPGTGASVPLEGVVLGLDIEGAFTRSVTNSARNVDIISKGDLAGMQDMIRRVVNLCFEPVEDSVSPYPRRRSSYPDDDDRVPSRNSTRTDGTPGRGDVVDRGFIPRVNYTMASVRREAEFLRSLHDSMLLDRPLSGISDEDPGRPTRSGSDSGNGSGLLPVPQLKARFRLKRTMVNDDKQAVAKQVSLKDSTSVIVIPGYLSSVAKKIETVQVQPLQEKQFRAEVKHSMATPLQTGIYVKDGEQWTINAAFVFNARSAFTPKRTTQYSWDAAWPKTDGDLYFRIGSGHWTPVGGRTIIESGVIGGGELQFYVDRASIFNKLPPKLREPGCFGLCEPIFSVSRIAPEYFIQVSGRRIDVR